MLNFLIVLLTTFLIIDCLILILLVLIQLPKKEAGAALAFGSGATDALFGAGSGNALTKMTKYVAGMFFALVVVLSVLTQGTFRKDTTGFEQQLKQEASKQTDARPAAAATNATPFKPLTNAATLLTNAAATVITGAVAAPTTPTATPQAPK
ncbi:MAG: preprotein translocase subunit SecG [Verrucomicrobia bacterium]|nr:preprotein translocase subunit SecG [Verrucomicrobiota bacterium]